MDEERRRLIEQKTYLEQQLQKTDVLRDPVALRERSIEHARIEKRLLLIEEYDAILREVMEHERAAASDDPELAALASSELESLRGKSAAAEKRLNKSESKTSKNVIIEIRAGAGGLEASLFASELFAMYRGYAAHRGWKSSLISESKNDLGGIKEVVFEINGAQAYSELKHESGVHRVQRVPETEKNGRIHTSTASVAVLPKAEVTDIEIKPQDISMEFFRSSGPGGQNVNKVETAVRITHLSTGVTITSQESRSQQQNRERAMMMLRSKLLDEKIRRSEEKTAAERREQIGTQDRSEKIRTYNFPQDRVTDHRIKTSWHGIVSIMGGNLDSIVESLQQQA